MCISKYAAYFHDGSLIDIKHEANKMEISIESAQIEPDEIEDNIVLSYRNTGRLEYHTIRGILHIIGIKKIETGVNEKKIFEGFFKKKYDSGTVLDFEIKNNIVELGVLWKNYPPKPRGDTDYTFMTIEAEKIYWENIPDLVDPFW